MLLVLAAGCGGDGGTTVDSADGELEEPRRKGPPYEAVAVTEAGTITGTVTFAAAGGTADTASVAAAGSAAAPAPASGATTAAGATACAAPPSSQDVVVYLASIARGRALPDTTPRRHELAVTRCDMQPRVLVAATGGTLNLSNGVGIVHRVSFTFEGMRNPMLRIPFSDAGQLVPLDRVLAIPGHVTIASDQGPGVTAQLIIVEHPYAVATRDGRFTIDSVPPGTYSLVAVGASGRTEGAVRVEAGRTTTINLTGQSVALPH